MTLITRQVSRILPLLFLIASAAGTLVLARFFVSPASFDWPAWVQAVGSITAIVGTFVIANQQHIEERRLEQGRLIAEQIRRFEAVRALNLNLAGSIAGAGCLRDDLHFAPTPSRVLTALEDGIRTLEGLPLFDLPHHLLVIYCTSLPQVIKRIHALLEQQNAYVSNSMACPQGDISLTQLEGEYRAAVSFNDEIGALCERELAICRKLMSSVQ